MTRAPCAVTAFGDAPVILSANSISEIRGAHPGRAVTGTTCQSGWRQPVTVERQKGDTVMGPVLPREPRIYYLSSVSVRWAFRECVWVGDQLLQIVYPQTILQVRTEESWKLWANQYLEKLLGGVWPAAFACFSCPLGVSAVFLANFPTDLTT